MMKISLLKLSFILVCFSFTSLKAQETTLSTGGTASGNGGTATYSVGQVVFTTMTGTNGSVAQGVQQAYEISIITAINEVIGIHLICTAYPNPVSDHLTLNIDNYQNENLSYLLYDMNGRIYDNIRITTNRTMISMGNLLPATYFLKIINNKTEVKIFKIIKR